jgi:heat shock protein HtpX
MKRIVLFVLTNLAVMLVLGVTASLLGVNKFLTANGLNLGMLLAFSLLMGFGGAIISLLISKPMAKWSTKAVIINDSTDPTHRWIVGTVRTFATKAGIGMPDVALYEGAPNAFATGAFKNSALVAVSTGLLQSMTKEEVEAVIGHEVAHVANGDMVTMTLIQGVMNTFVVFISRVVGYFVDKVILKNDRDGVGIGYYVTTIVMDIALGLVAAVIVWLQLRKSVRIVSEAPDELLDERQIALRNAGRLDQRDVTGRDACAVTYSDERPRHVMWPLADEFDAGLQRIDRAGSPLRAGRGV